MTTEEDYNVVDTMEKYGGSFVQTLSELFRRADGRNFLKLRILFAEYWEEYKDLYYKNEKENKKN